MVDAVCTGLHPSAVISQLAEKYDVSEAIRILSFCGLNDAFLFLRKYNELSEGQKYRYKLAKLIDQKE